MSDSELSPEEALVKRHRKEKKDLQAKIQNLKKTSSKGKKKKEVSDEIAKLEEDLKVRHERELKELQESSTSPASVEVDNVVENLQTVTIDGTSSEGPPEQRLSKAEKRRLKKEQDDLKREEEIRAAEEANRHGPRNVETQSIKQQLEERGLAIHDVPSNGDCMFAAILHQAPAGLCQTGVSQLRLATADELRRNKPEYLPFLPSATGDDMMQDPEFEDYCQKMATQQTAWGSQVELRAISQVFRLRIEVVQGEGPIVVIGEENQEKKPIVVTFHKHYFGLGEHYNSTKPLPPPEVEEEQ